jgi:outer membrane immunogenic protein
MKKFLFASVAAAAFCGAPAFAADMAAKAPVYKAPVAASAPSWTGFYIGLNAGYGWSGASTNMSGVDPLLFIPALADGQLPTSLSPNIHGFVGGGQFGYNWQFGQYVAGLETDIDYSAMRGVASYVFGAVGPLVTVTTTQSEKLTWLGTTRARLGWLATPSTMVFATGGLAYGGAEASTNVNVPVAGPCPLFNGFCSVGSASKTLFGWTIGGGVESIIAAHWTAKVEYLYYNLGNVSVPVVSTANFGIGGTVGMLADSKFNGQIVRGGVNYKF